MSLHVPTVSSLESQISLPPPAPLFDAGLTATSASLGKACVAGMINIHHPILVRAFGRWDGINFRSGHRKKALKYSQRGYVMSGD